MHQLTEMSEKNINLKNHPGVHRNVSISERSSSLSKMSEKLCRKCPPWHPYTDSQKNSELRISKEKPSPKMTKIEIHAAHPKCQDQKGRNLSKLSIIKSLSKCRHWESRSSPKCLIRISIIQKLIKGDQRCLNCASCRRLIQMPESNKVPLMHSPRRLTKLHQILHTTMPPCMRTGRPTRHDPGNGTRNSAPSETVVNLEGFANRECYNHGWNMGLILHHLLQFLWAEPYSSWTQSVTVDVQSNGSALLKRTTYSNSDNLLDTW
jgi:hypothetical protein